MGLPDAYDYPAGVRIPSLVQLGLAGLLTHHRPYGMGISGTKNRFGTWVSAIIKIDYPPK